jgi:xanthine dehydrogenase molybdopterin-binding subunit B
VKSVPDFAQVEGAFVQGVGFFTNEEYRTNSDGMLINDGTYTYKIPTVDTIPKQFNVEFFDSPHSQKRVLSSKGEASDLSSALACIWFYFIPSQLCSF